MFTRGGDGGRRSTRTGTPRAREGNAGVPREASTETPGPWGWGRRIGLAAVVAGGLFLFLVFQLSRPGLPYRTELVERWSTDYPQHLGLHLRSAGVALERTALEGGRWMHSLDLRELVPLPGADLRSVDLLFDVRVGDSPIGERAGRASVVHAALQDIGRRRTLVMAEGAEVRGEELVEFRVPGPRPDREAGGGTPPALPSQWRLEVQTRNDVSLALRCLVGVAPDDAPSTNGGSLGVRVPVENSEKARWGYPHGRVTRWHDAPPMTRAGLVASLWDRGSAGWTYGWIGVASLAVALGIVWVPVGPTDRAGRRAGWSAGLLFGGLGLVYLVVTPPFMGIDEPSHVFSYHRWQRDDAATRDAWDLGFRTQLARLMMRPHQKVTPGDVGGRHWWFIADPSTMDTRPQLRSVVAARIWSATRGWIAGEPAAVQLWRLRWTSLLLASAGVGIAAGLMAGRVAGEARAPALGWWLLLVPSLPYFAMNVSNYPVLIGLWAVVAACVARVVHHAAVPAGVMTALGLAFGLALHTSVNAIPMAVLVVVVLAGWLLGREPRQEASAEGDGDGAPTGGSRALGWLGLGAGMVVAHLASSREFDAQLVRTAAQYLPWIARWGAWPLWLGLFAGCGLLALLEAGVSSWSSSSSRGPGGTKARRWPGIRVAALAVLAGLAVNTVTGPHQAMALHEAVPLWDFFPHRQLLLPPAVLPAPPDANPPMVPYVEGVVRAFASSWGGGEGDYLVAKTFWLENGYLDSLAPSWELRVLTTFFALGLVLLLWRLSDHPSRARAVRLLAVLVGVFGALAAYAVAARASVATPTLHGRYLIGLYLALLGVCFLGWKGILVRWQVRRPLRLALWLVLVPVLLQAASYAVALERYFGRG